MSKKKQTALVPTGKTSPILYARMAAAIAECCAIDDCKHIATQAAAIAAYYKQIKDDESVRKFLQVKIRAWRRIGEILVAANIDKSECNLSDGTFNMAEYIRRIRAAFKGRKEVTELGDQAIRQAIKLAELPREFFDQHVGEHASSESLLGAFAMIQRKEWEATPEGQAELKRWKEINKKTAAEAAQREREYREQVQEEEKERRETAHRAVLESKELSELKAQRDEAFNEVGITLERRYREEMHQTVFLLKKPIHEILRQAAFDNRMTMQSILRAGLMMWFIAHGYNVPSDDMNLPSRDKPQPPRRGMST